MKKIILIGGSAIDNIATSDQPLEPKVSNSGKSLTAFGGVTRNVAHNLAKLGNKVMVVTALGNDEMAASLKRHYASLGIKLTVAPTKFPTPTYVAINDSNRDMAVAVFDNRAIKDITPNYIKKIAKIINQYDYIFIDGNDSKETIEYVCNRFKNKKIFCDPIAPEFVHKFLGVLDKIYLMKCNIYEARALVNQRKIQKEVLIKAIFKKGLKNVVVSDSRNDVYYGLNKKDIYHYPVTQFKKIANTTGCGDALMSGIIDHLSLGKNFHDAISFGNKLANLTLMSHGANSSELVKYAHK